ncbi:hypothetical protein LXL04_036932 [Taraxacum kok-saghyz]
MFSILLLLVVFLALVDFAPVLLSAFESPNSEDALEHNIVSVQPQYTWTQVVGDKLYKGQLFDSFEDAFGYYKDYVRRSRNAHYAPETYKPGQIQMHSTPERNKSVYAFVVCLVSLVFVSRVCCILDDFTPIFGGCFAACCC